MQQNRIQPVLPLAAAVMALLTLPPPASDKRQLVLPFAKPPP